MTAPIPPVLELAEITAENVMFDGRGLIPRRQYHWGWFADGPDPLDDGSDRADAEGALSMTISVGNLGEVSRRVWLRIYLATDWPARDAAPPAEAAPVAELPIRHEVPPAPAPDQRPARVVRLARSEVDPTPDMILTTFVRQATGDRMFARYLSSIEARLRPQRSPRTWQNPGTYRRLVDLTAEFLANARIGPVVGATDYLVGADGQELPYINTVTQRYPDARRDHPLSDIDADLLAQPFPVELIWSYWQEEGGLVQALNLILARFQNRRVQRGPDPLARFDLSPLRPLRSILYDWAEDEIHRLTVRRRSAEYEYEYGLQLIGDAIPGSMRPAETRTRFLESFHSLVFEAHRFFPLDDDSTVHADAFPVLNALRDTHLVLAEGAHNQYGDLPTQARIQMLVMQWILAQPEMRDFLGGKPMVPYQEAWMDRVDTIRTVAGWSPTSVTHFHEMAVIGEQLLLSVRYGNWNDLALDADNAANWARAWRGDIQRYTHAYRAATGVDLSQGVDVTMPAVLLARRERSVGRRA